SDSDASGAGGITMSVGSSIDTDGGDVLFFGGDDAPPLSAVTDPTTDPTAFLNELLATGARGVGGHGITINGGASIDAGAGNIELRGVGDDGYDGVHLAAGASVSTTFGGISIYGLGGGDNNDTDGVSLAGD